MTRKLHTRLLAVTLPIFLVGCALIGKFDQNSYNAAQSLQVTSLALMGQRLTSIPSNDIITMQARLGAQLAYEGGKGVANRLSCLQWQILTSTNGHLLGEFLVDWMKGTPCTQSYLTEKENQINEGFNSVLQLEGAKQRP